MEKVKSREYKVMLRGRLFETRRAAVEAMWDEVRVTAAILGIDEKKSFESSEKRKIVFYDTPDFTLRKNQLVLRRREHEDGEAQYTLKHRAEDRYVANAVNVDAVGYTGKTKFEEDIAAPFRSRFSHSNTITIDDPSEQPEFGEKPTDIGEAATVFPALAGIRHDGRRLSKRTALVPVRGIEAFERVYAGPKLVFPDDNGTVAFVLWSQGRRGRTLVAELSYRYKDKGEDYSAALAAKARVFFQAIQGLDWCAPRSATKTRYVYGEIG